MKSIVLLFLAGCAAAAAPAPAPEAPQEDRSKRMVAEAMARYDEQQAANRAVAQPVTDVPQKADNIADPAWCAADATERHQRLAMRKAELLKARSDAKPLLDWREAHCNPGAYSGGKLDGRIVWACPAHAPPELRPGSTWHEPTLAPAASHEEEWKNEHCPD